MWIRSAIVATLAIGVLLSACGKSESPPPSRPPAPAPAPPPQAAAPRPTQPAQFRVVAVDLGKAVGADKKVAQPAASFAPGDTIFAVVSSDGSAPSIALKARWTYQDGQLVDETARTIAPTGPTTTEFHIAKPSGWPTGRYKVEISANGASVAVKEFAVD
jgi:hypothetical protein